MNPLTNLMSMDKRKLAIAMSILAMLMVANPHIVFAQTTTTSNGYVIYIDPITAGSSLY